jgi:hypothetical protein
VRLSNSRLRLSSALGILAAAAVLLVPQAAQAAQASPASPAGHKIIPEICGNGGTGYCLNAWNGGPYVKMYYGGGYTNDYFYFQAVSPCSGNDTVQSTGYGDKTNCPFTNSSIDYALHNDLIVELVDGNNHECVGTGNLNGVHDVGYLGSCGNGSGAGAIQGALDVEYTPICPSPSGTETALVNRYWTNTYNSGYYGYVSSGGNPARPLYTGVIGNQTCWATHNG